jgi:hypothetical protein
MIVVWLRSWIPGVIGSTQDSNTVSIIANRFEISDPEKDLLERGGMGEVSRATDTQTGETVAVCAQP